MDVYHGLDPTVMAEHRAELDRRKLALEHTLREVEDRDGDSQEALFYRMGQRGEVPSRWREIYEKKLAKLKDEA